MARRRYKLESAFSKVFKEVKGVTPGEFKRISRVAKITGEYFPDALFVPEFEGSAES